MLSLPNKILEQLALKTQLFPSQPLGKKIRMLKTRRRIQLKTKNLLSKPQKTGNDLAAIMSYLKNVNDKIDEVICKPKNMIRISNS